MCALTFASGSLAGDRYRHYHYRSSFNELGTFSDGWRAGWEAGYKSIKGSYALVPFAEFPPFPELGRNTFEDGFGAGFVAGRERACEN
jgi:hypothetical protein